MLKSITLFVSLLLGLLFMPCCKNKINRQDAHKSFSREILSGRDGQELFESIKPIRDSLKLDTLENGYDSLEIRIWMALRHKQQVFIIRNDKGKWGATIINFSAVLNEKMDSLLYYKKEYIYARPKISWDNLIEQLVRHQILTLPDDSKLANCDHPFDGLNLAIEVSSINEYRLYTYHAPGVNLQLPEARHIVKILDILKEQFGVKSLE